MEKENEKLEQERDDDMRASLSEQMKEAERRAALHNENRDEVPDKRKNLEI